MNFPELEPKSRLGIEILELLYSTMVRESIAVDADDTYENLRRLKLIQVLYDDIVLRLCKLTDRSGQSLGVPKLIQRLRRSKADLTHCRRAEDALTDLQKHTAQLEPYRNTRVAHIGRTQPGLIPHPPLRPAVLAAVALVDAVAGGRQEYRVWDLDLRVVVLRESAG